MLDIDNLKNCCDTMERIVELANKNLSYAETSFTGAVLIQIRKFLKELEHINSKDDKEEISKIVKNFNIEFQKAYELFFKIK